MIGASSSKTSKPSKSWPGQARIPFVGVGASMSVMFAATLAATGY
jgi:hypothetical protein